jgi:histidinol-phosphatase (PHP family)
VSGDRQALPADSHVHSEWSWDAPYGSMSGACRIALETGLRSIVFTEHVDFTARRVAPVPAWQRRFVQNRILTPPAFDVTGYRDALEKCRKSFPELTVLSGVELGEPHWHRHRVVEILAGPRFDRVLASVHMMRDVSGDPVAVKEMFRRRHTPAWVVRQYLAEVLELVTGFADFDVLAHVDYAARYWPSAAGPYRIGDFTEEYRQILAALAERGKALEINTRVPLHPQVVRWWHEIGGHALTFASDAHRPEQVARGFAEASAMAEAAGFAPGPDPEGLWERRPQFRTIR